MSKSETKTTNVISMGLGLKFYLFPPFLPHFSKPLGGVAGKKVKC